MAESIAVRLLGPIEVVGPRGRATFTGSRQRSLVALLALQTGQVISSDRLIDGLWGEDVPRTALRTLQSHVARVRQAVHTAGLPDAVGSAPAGFVLRLPTEAVDAHVFAQRSRHARACLAAGAIREAASLLQEGLGLWRGEALQDGEVLGNAGIHIDRLHEARSSAMEDLCDARLRLGDSCEVVGALHALLAEHPYRERSAGLLMLALYQAGRAAEALDVYLRLRVDLAEGLGVDPGVELQDLYTAMLRQEPALNRKTTPVVVERIEGPTELPPQVGYFTGRADEFASLDKLLAGRDADADGKVVLISGAAGIGKTALAVQWAHHAADRFPDGQLFLDLQGNDPQWTFTPAAVVTALLRSLGVPADRLPADATGQVGLYRSLVHHRRLLILLDNAGTLEQVVHAVPPTKSSLLVITSRQELSALAVRQPVHFVHLPALDPGTGLELLSRAVDAERIEGERAAATDLVAFCGGMPLAVRITAARLAGQPTLGVTDLLHDVKLRELDALSVPGDSAGIRAVFASAYLSLNEPVRRTFRLLSLHPGPSFTVHLAAAITGEPLGVAARHVATLAAASLLDPAGSDRYRFHDLIRLYAAECARTEESPDGFSQCQERVFDWYRGIAHAANRLLDPARDRVEVDPPLTAVPFGRTPREVIAFLDGERSSLRPVVHQAAEAGRFTVAWQLTYLVAGYYDSRGGGQDRLDMCDVAVKAAQTLGDAEAEVLMRNVNAATCVLMRRFDEALVQLGPALPLARKAADTWLLATTHTNMAVANTWLRRHDAAREAFEQALAIHTANADSHAIALTWNNLGDLQRRAGHPQRALDHLARALEVVSTLDSPRLEAIVRQSAGQAQRASGAGEAAIEQFHIALALRRRIGDRRGEANALHEIGAIHLERDDVATAIPTLRQALDVSRQLGNDHLEAVLLNRIGQALLHTGDLPGAADALRHSLRLRTRIPDADEEASLRRNLDELHQCTERPAHTET